MLTVAVFHWQIPGEAFMRSYLWDTRSFVAFPAVQWTHQGPLDARVRFGPAVATMGEGPDDAVTVGANAEIELAADLLSVKWTVGTGWMWLVRESEADPALDGDQHGLMLFAGVTF